MSIIFTRRRGTKREGAVLGLVEADRSRASASRKVNKIGPFVTAFIADKDVAVIRSAVDDAEDRPVREARLTIGKGALFAVGVDKQELRHEVAQKVLAAADKSFVGESLRRARAIAILCFCPSERSAPRSPTIAP